MHLFSILLENNKYWKETELFVKPLVTNGDGKFKLH